MDDFNSGPRVHYNFPDGHGKAVFIRRCPKCGGFVKADDILKASIKTIGIAKNATCKKCGRVTMDFEGWF